MLTVADRLATRGPRTREAAIRRHLALAREVMDAHFTLVDRGPVTPLLAGDEIAARARPRAGPVARRGAWTRCARGRWWAVIRTDAQARRFVRSYFG